jgi:ferredoxin-NADP reductase
MTAAAVAEERLSDDRFSSRDLRVSQVRWEATDVISITLVSPDGADLPPWRPGAHLDLRLASGLTRQYSLCGDPTDRGSYTIAVLREQRGRGGSVELHDTPLVGRTLNTRGPRNHFELRAAPRYLFLAGGIGITPIMAMVREAVATGVPWELYYGGRGREHMAFADQLLELGGDRVHLVPQDSHGILDLPAIVGGSPEDAEVYVCGPEGMLRAAEEACAGVRPPRQLRLERFTVATPPAPAAGGAAGTTATAEGRTPFEVELRRSGLTLKVPPDRGLLDVVRDALPDVPYSCEEGYCGSCEARVLEGVPEHNDEILTEDERVSNETMMICVGRSKSEKLVLDL